MYKQNVQKALDALRDTLVSCGANPFRIDLPRPSGVLKVGVDDFIIQQEKNAKKAFLNLERIPLFLADGIRGDALIQKEIKPLVYVVPKLLPQGLTILAGPPKIGKSWLILSIVAALASGTRALEHYDTEESEVMYLALEDTERRLQDRLKKIVPNFAKAKNAHFFCTWESVDRKGLLALERHLEQNKNCKAVFIDTLGKVRRPSQNKNSYYEDYEAASALKKIADDFGIAMVVVHHTRKEKADDPFNRISGTTGLTGSADTIIVLDRGRNNADGILYISGRDVEEQELALSFTEGIWKVLGTAAPYYANETRQKIMLALVESGEALGPTNIAREVGCTVGTLSKTLKRMVSDGLIKKVGNGKYVVVDKKPKFAKRS